MPRLSKLAALAFLAVVAAVPVNAQDLKPAAPSKLALAEQDPASRAVLAVIDSAMDVITAGNLIAMADLMLPEGLIFLTFDTDSGAGYQAVTVAQQRERGSMQPFVERGFNPTVMIAGHVAMVWLPYDLWYDGKWSHCGVDTFTLVNTASGWRIALLAYSIEQPPACKPHPAGTPAGYAPRQ